MTQETLMLSNFDKNICIENTDKLLDTENKSQVNVKFPVLKIKLENNFPASDKTLTSIMTDFLLLTETGEKYAQSRNIYLENLLNEEKTR